MKFLVLSNMQVVLIDHITRLIGAMLAAAGAVLVGMYLSYWLGAALFLLLILGEAFLQYFDVEDVKILQIRPEELDGMEDAGPADIDEDR